MHVFYKSEVHDKELYLDEEESRHCVRVLRLKEQDIVYLVNGQGGFYHASLAEANQKKCKLIVHQVFEDYGKRNYHLTIAIAPTKNLDRFEWFLEKATEIGIDRIIPIICKQSERKIIKLDRSKKILIEAIKQSQQAYLPKLDDLHDFNSLIKMPFDGIKTIAYCSNEDRMYLKDISNPGDKVLVLIGPEGDFAPDEIKMALNSGYQGISLGKNRLRTETAGLVACNTIATINQ